ncbi:hypothetical protein LIA77_08838 [Sarocladium implicatum]|nr:hypothetical protein LIA77_08838 [Sarocladium implicatum]
MKVPETAPNSKPPWITTYTSQLFIFISLFANLLNAHPIDSDSIEPLPTLPIRTDIPTDAPVPSDFQLPSDFTIHTYPKLTMPESLRHRSVTTAASEYFYPNYPMPEPSSHSKKEEDDGDKKTVTVWVTKIHTYMNTNTVYKVLTTDVAVPATLTLGSS